MSVAAVAVLPLLCCCLSVVVVAVPNFNNPLSQRTEPPLHPNTPDVFHRIHIPKAAQEAWAHCLLAALSRSHPTATRELGLPSRSWFSADNAGANRTANADPTTMRRQCEQWLEVARGLLWQKPRTSHAQTRTQRLFTRPTRRRGRFLEERRASHSLGQRVPTVQCIHCLAGRTSSWLPRDSYQRDASPSPRFLRSLSFAPDSAAATHQGRAHLG